MKRFLPIFALITLSACDFYYVEPRYDSRAALVGYYDVEEYSSTYNDMTYYSMRVSKSSHAGEIYLNNFYASDISVYAYLDYNTITIPYQVVDGYEIEGSGTVNGTRLNLTYRVKDVYNNTRTDFCETTAWQE